MVRTADVARGEQVAVFDEQQVDHQADDVARGEVLAGGLVGDFGELADQLLKGEAHVVVADLVGMQREGREPLGDLVEQPGLAQPVHLLGEAEALEDVAHGGGEAADIGGEVGEQVVLVTHQRLQVEGRGVDEAELGDAQQERLGVDAERLLGRLLGQYGGLGGGEHAIQPAQHGEGENDAAVFGRLVVSAEQVGDGPDKGRQGCGLAQGRGPRCRVQKVRWREAARGCRALPSQPGTGLRMEDVRCARHPAPRSWRSWRTVRRMLLAAPPRSGRTRRRHPASHDWPRSSPSAPKAAPVSPGRVGQRRPGPGVAAAPGG